MKFNIPYRLCIWVMAATCLACCRRTTTGEELANDTIQYQVSGDIFPNPERGFIRTMSVKSGGAGLSSAQLNLLRGQHVTMILRVFYLDAFKDKAIDETQFNLISEDLGKIKDAGLKAILRFAYTDNMEDTDAPLDVVEQHLDQLREIFENNKSIIAFVQAGFIGAWGEWHSSSNGLTTVENQRKVLDKLLSVLPAGIMVQVRTPAFKQQIFNSTSALTAELAYTNDNRARVGHHNDCFLSGGTDYGTYNNIELEKQYISNEALYVPTGGETCPPTGGYDPTCAEGRREMKLLKWTYLNLDWYPATINAWKSSGCFDEFQTYLGYRLALSDARFPNQAAENGNLNIDINITNRGYAPLYHRKNVLLVLKNKSNGTYYDKPLAADLRLCKPGAVQNIKETVSLAGVPSGAYELYLRIADQDPLLAERSEYAIRLGNANGWEEEHNGMNRLNKQININ
ncbi:MAG: DUF4832 domain-containing protein [Chitinophagaceae bacterium]|nr:DUF4832 domain-containing protein [Chitinophagaceae bacterium]MCW5926024.1 DUF4832 domain-containing protein [Chitinophagaceae bacterium]